MIKGCERKILFVNGSESSLFESAYFVLRRSAEQEGGRHTDMLKEANRIIESSLPSNAARIRKRERRLKKLKSLVIFLLGAICGTALSAAISLLFLLPF